MSHKHGVIAGKFYPPHLGHLMLIEKALNSCDKVSVFVVWTQGQKPSGQTRVNWLTQHYADRDNVTFHLVADIATDDSTMQSSIDWAQYTKDILGEYPDTVFSSEQYGVNWAKCMGAEHVPLSFSRSYWPISGTEVRNDPYLYAQYILPEGRNYYKKRVLLVGAESVGKTTLCRKLADAYDTIFVPEYGRIYVEEAGSVENTNQLVIFGNILNNQIPMEETYLSAAHRILFCDTDLITTSLWWDCWQNGNLSSLGRSILEEGVTHTDAYDLILILDHEGVPWVDDGYRDQEGSRAWFTEQLMKRFTLLAPDRTHVLRGSYDERYDIAIKLVNRMVQPTKAVLPPER